MPLLIRIATKDQTHAAHLKKMTKRVKAVLVYLSNEYGFRLPPQIDIKIYNHRPRTKMRSLTFGQAEWENGVFSIKFNPCMFDSTEEHRNDIIAHEVAHIAEMLHVDKCSHSTLFYEMFEKAKQFNSE